MSEVAGQKPVIVRDRKRPTARRGLGGSQKTAVLQCPIPLERGVSTHRAQRRAARPSISAESIRLYLLRPSSSRLPPPIPSRSDRRPDRFVHVPPDLVIGQFLEGLLTRIGNPEAQRQPDDPAPVLGVLDHEALGSRCLVDRRRPASMCRRTLTRYGSVFAGARSVPERSIKMDPSYCSDPEATLTSTRTSFPSAVGRVRWPP